MFGTAICPIQNPEEIVSAESIQFVGALPRSRRQSLECLFFFNPRQSLLVSRIREAVEESGAPFVLEEAGRVRLAVPSGAMQCLFACIRRTKPVAVALYGRPVSDSLRIFHLVVDPEMNRLVGTKNGLACVMVEKVCQIARSIRGVRRVQLPYRRNGFISIAPAERVDEDSAPR